MTVFNDADAKTQNSTLSERPDTHKGEESQVVSASQARFEALEAKYAALEALVAKKATPTVTPKLTRPWPLGLRSLKLGLATVIGLSAVLATAAGTFGEGASSVPNTLTYEGYLEVDGEPADGLVYMTVKLHTSEEGAEGPLKTWFFNILPPEPLGVDEYHQVEVAAGRFAVELPDLDELHFDEKELWVAVEVGPSGSELTPLGGRQKLNSVPFAVKSRNADHAANAANAATLGGEPAAQVLGSIVPIGAITAWHKNLDGTPATLPDNWAECNGQVLNDAESPYDTTVLPNLNVNPMIEGEGFSGLFLRGGGTSGILQADATARNGLRVPNGTTTRGSGGNRVVLRLNDEGSITNLTINGDPETRPANMSVVWIIRIK